MTGVQTCALPICVIVIPEKSLDHRNVKAVAFVKQLVRFRFSPNAQGIQIFFRDYYYTRGSGFSFLLEEKPEYARYFTPWAQVAPTAFPNPAENQIIENYCSGVYLSPKQVVQLLRDLEQMPKVLEDLEGLWSDGQFAVLKKALTAAAELGVGLLEATEVVEPNPIRPNESTSYSNLYHCDREGVYLYMDTVSRQIEDAIRKSEE